jgi:hypothetical protein
LRRSDEYSITNGDWELIGKHGMALHALAILGHLLNGTDRNRALQQMALFLQDEDSMVREKAASMISLHICLVKEVNSIACWALIVQMFPDVLKQVEQFNAQNFHENMLAEIADDCIFDSIEKNTFFESFCMEEEQKGVNYLLGKLES